MASLDLQVLAVVGSLKANSVTRVAMKYLAQKLAESGCSVDFLDLQKEPLPLYNPDASRLTREYLALRPRVDGADILVLGTPDYHGSVSSAMKNFLDHFWHEFAGKLFASVIASHEKGLTVADQLRTIARQCYAWSLPYGISFTENTDVKDGAIVSHTLPQRLDMLARDLRVYGGLLSHQRKMDLTSQDSCFMARHRK